MKKIRVLSEQTANQIAAGEVVENPSSVVKELVENSIDAGAKKIWVEIRGGGFVLIQVADDGCGMSAEDAELSFMRHATSKMIEIDDLLSLSSMGFRGEALASIAAISHVELLTAEEGTSGTRVDVAEGKIEKIISTSRAKGTTVAVRSLFCNVPARKKFQKSAAASTSSIHKLMISLALAHPAVGFELTSNDKLVFSVAPQENPSFLELMKKRLEMAFDAPFLQGCKTIEVQKEGYRLQGFLGSPADTRVNRLGQYLFVNGRAIISFMVSHAVKEGYGYRLDERRFPAFILHLVVPSEKLDVNVHPQKLQVRFQDEAWVRRFLQKEVEAVFHGGVSPLFSSDWTPSEIPYHSLQTGSFQFREEPAEEPNWIEDPEVIGLYAHYLLLNGETIPGGGEGIIWVNLQKVHKHLILAKMKKHENGSQALLIPLPLSLNREEQIDLQKNKERLHEMGFSIEVSGKDSYLVHAIPSFMEMADVIPGIKLLLDEDVPVEKFVTFAARGKKRFVIQEALALFRAVKDLQDPEMITLVTPHEIEKRFR